MPQRFLLCESVDEVLVTGREPARGTSASSLTPSDLRYLRPPEVRPVPPAPCQTRSASRSAGRSVECSTVSVVVQPQGTCRTIAGTRLVAPRAPRDASEPTMSNGESGCPGSRYEGAVLIIDRDVASACVIAVVLARFMPVRIA